MTTRKIRGTVLSATRVCVYICFGGTQPAVPLGGSFCVLRTPHELCTSGGARASEVGSQTCHTSALEQGRGEGGRGIEHCVAQRTGHGNMHRNCCAMSYAQVRVSARGTHGQGKGAAHLAGPSNGGRTGGRLVLRVLSCCDITVCLSTARLVTYLGLQHSPHREFLRPRSFGRAWAREGGWDAA